MFHSIPEPVFTRMRQLEAQDVADRMDGTPHASRLRQISAETGRLLAMLAAGAPQGQMIEIGTSAGYSTLWLYLASTVNALPLTTLEVLPEKVALAQETFRICAIAGKIDLIQGDARELLGGHSDIAFCFLDADKHVYPECYELVIPRLVRGGLLVADNVVSHEDTLRAFIMRAHSDTRVDSVMIPLGKGLLVSRKI